MNWPSKLFDISEIYWNHQGWRTAGTLAAYVPRATNFTGAWIHAPPLLEESGLVDLGLLYLLFTSRPTMAHWCWRDGIKGLEFSTFSLLTGVFLHLLASFLSPSLLVFHLLLSAIMNYYMSVVKVVWHCDSRGGLLAMLEATVWERLLVAHWFWYEGEWFFGLGSV